MARAIIYKGEDKIVSIGLTSDGVPVTLTSLSGIVVVFYNKKTKKVLRKYSLNTLSGYDTLTIVSNTIRINLDRAITIISDEGELDCEILEEISTVGFEDSEFRSIAVAEIGNIVRTIQGSIPSL